MTEKGGGEDITGAGGVYLLDRISLEAFGSPVLKEGCAMSSIGGDKQRYLRAPTGEDGIGLVAAALGEWEQVVVAEDEDIQKRYYLIGGGTAGSRDASSIIPTAQPALRRGGDDRSWTTGEKGNKC